MSSRIVSGLFLIVFFVFALVLVAPAKGSLSSSYNDGSQSFGYYASESGTQTFVGTYYSTDIGNITYASIGAWSSGNSVTVFTDIVGTMGAAPYSTYNDSQSLDITRSGLQIQSFIGTSFYDANNGGGGKGIALAGAAPTAPNWWATSSGSLEIDGPTILSATGNGYYDEYGGYYDPNNGQWIPTTTSFYTNITFVCQNAADASRIATVVNASQIAVPEPASLSVLASAGLLIIRRRRR